MPKSINMTAFIFIVLPLLIGFVYLSLFQSKLGRVTIARSLTPLNAALLSNNQPSAKEGQVIAMSAQA